MSGAYFNPAHSLDRAAAAHPERVNIWYGERSWSVTESAQCTLDLAYALRDLGVHEGSRVAMISRNSPWHLFLHVACARLGAVFVPLSYRLPADELSSVCAYLQPQLLVADPETASGVTPGGATVGEAYERGAKYAQHFFVIDDDCSARLSEELAPPEAMLNHAHEQGWLPLSSLLNQGRTAQECESRGYAAHGSALSGNCASAQKHALNCAHYPEGLGAILLTSGTAGEPKFVGLTHENLWWGSRNFREGFEYSNLDIELVVAPMSHIGGFNGTTLDLFSHGGTVVVVRQFVPSEVVRELTRRRVCMMFAVPAMYMALLEDAGFSAQNLPEFRLPLTGGGPVSRNMLDALLSVGLRPLNVWGMTETSASGCYLPAEHIEQRAGSIGRPFAHVQATISPCQGIASFGDDSLVGELCVRGPSVVKNYWEADSCAGEEAEEGKETDSWLHTGDLARLDSDGYLWIVGRIDDLISTGGEIVAPQEVEAVLARHEHIREAVVIGLPDPVWGQVVAAAIVPAGEEPSLRSVREFARASLADYKLPRKQIVLSHLPLTAHGKIDRAALAALM